MIVSNHQIRNVLKLYSRQLGKGRIGHSGTVPIRRPSAEAVNISAEGKRQAMIERLVKDIFGRIVRKDPKHQMYRQIVERMKSEVNEDQNAGEDQQREFVYNVIEADATKKLNTLNIDDSRYLIERLNHNAREAVKKNLD